MTEHELKHEYFEWMCNLVYNPKYSKKYSYKKLLSYLHHTEFTYIIPLDGNRYEDGINLRYRFGYDNGIDDSIISSYLDNEPCSILEMLVALAFRCEVHIMDDPEIGDRTGQWFWNMIVNLGLGSMTDARFDENYIVKVIDRFLNRQYEADGRGGVVHIPNCRCDLRKVEIWYQMMWYLNEVVKE